MIVIRKIGLISFNVNYIHGNIFYATRNPHINLFFINRNKCEAIIKLSSRLDKT